MCLNRPSKETSATDQELEEHAVIGVAREVEERLEGDDAEQEA